MFGHVISGQAVVKQIEGLPVDRRSRPLQDAKVVNCGELVPKSKTKGIRHLDYSCLQFVNPFVCLEEKKKRKVSTSSESSSASSSSESESSAEEGEVKKEKKSKKQKKKLSSKDKKKNKSVSLIQCYFGITINFFLIIDQPLKKKEKNQTERLKECRIL